MGPGLPDFSGRLLWRAADGFDVEAIRIQNERAVIVLIVMWAKSGRTIVFSAGFQRRAVKGIDLGPGLGGERHVQLAPGRVLLGEPEHRTHLAIAYRVDAAGEF